MSLFKKCEKEELQIYDLTKKNSELEARNRLFETTIEQLKRAFDKQEKVVDETEKLKIEINGYRTQIDELVTNNATLSTQFKEEQEKASYIEKLKSETDKLTSELKKQTNEGHALYLELQTSIASNAELKAEMESLISTNKELLGKIGWVRTGKEKDNQIGYYGNGKFIKVKKEHLIEPPETIAGTDVTFADETIYPLSLMLFLWGSKEITK